jgi:hypothetical protein
LSTLTFHPPRGQNTPPPYLYLIHTLQPLPCHIHLVNINSPPRTFFVYPRSDQSCPRPNFVFYSPAFLRNSPVVLHLKSPLETLVTPLSGKVRGFARNHEISDITLSLVVSPCQSSEEDFVIEARHLLNKRYILAHFLPLSAVLRTSNKNTHFCPLTRYSEKSADRIPGTASVAVAPSSSRIHHSLSYI